MYCNRCGTQNPNNSVYCSKCGLNLTSFPNTNPHPGSMQGQGFQQQGFQQQGFQQTNGFQNNQGWNQAAPSYAQPQGVKKKKKGCGCGCLSTLTALIMIAGIVLYFIPDDAIPNDHDYISDPSIEFNSEELMAELSMESYITAEIYREATIRTMELLKQGPDEVDYATWQQNCDEILELWDTVDKLSLLMEQTADDVIASDAVGFAPFDGWQNPFVSYALTKQDVNAIYDSAPKGQGLKTLAKQLNVSAKEAFSLLKSTNQELAQTWNNKADTYQKLENTARAVKDVSKATVFVGSLIATGGASSLVEAGVIAVSGADLAIEICEDVSIIQYGDQSKAAKSLGKIRSVTEPVASIVGLTGLKALFNGKNIAALGKEIANLSGAEQKAKMLELGLAKLDHAGAILMTVDMTSAYAQENKILGISLDQAKQAGTKGTATIQADLMTKDEARANNIDVDFSDPDYAPPTDSPVQPAEIPTETPDSAMVTPDVTDGTPEVVDVPDPIEPEPIEQGSDDTGSDSEYTGGGNSVLDLMDTDCSWQQD